MTEILAVGTLIVMVLLAYMQVQKNHLATIAAQEAHLRNQLRVTLYEKAAATFHEAAESFSAAQSSVSSIVSSFDLASKGLPMAPSHTAQDVISINMTAARAVSKVLIFLEQYEIVFSKFRAIRREFSEAHRRLLDAHGALYSKLILYLPVTSLQTGQPIGPVSTPSSEQIAELRTLQEAYSDVCGDLSGYVVDLQIEAQNELLSPLFGKTLPPRHPQDPSVKVLARDPVDGGDRPVGRLA